MKTLYFDGGMGAAGDMLTAALLELLPDPEGFVAELNALKIPGVEYHREPSVKCGITGTHMTVKVHGEEEESHDHHHEHEHHHEDHEHHHEHDDDHGEHHHHHDEEHPHEHFHDHEEGHHHDHDHHHEHEHGEHDHHHDHEGHGHHHHHASMADIEHIVRDHLELPKKVQDDVLAVYGLIAEAESHAHGRPVTEIHFHEVGTMDAIADVVAVCLLMNKIAPDEVIVSPVHVGSGQVHCAHGILPVPAPATAFILKDAPIYGGAIRGELCTPTGAALLKHFATKFGSMPAMRVSAIGYGMGKKDFEAANCVRAMLGESDASAQTGTDEDGKRPTTMMSRDDASKQPGTVSKSGAWEPGEEVYELSCNVDDMTGEEIGFAMERLFEAGARDVYTIPIGMKKNRPGILIRTLCTEDTKEKIVETIFKHTTTIGIRECAMKRYVLDRKLEEVETPYGTIHRKTSTGYGTKREKLEFDDLAKIAREQGISLWEARERIRI
ncbi:MAG: nickel pincer cofactor biosynthesis protein LarC [Lachnospiraceae bacterium]|nr:nickel pincer cofactor biosynthesis protein LarC [Lachnospiraceae bacterium]